MLQNRRSFLRYASASAAGLGLVASPLLPLRWLDSRLSADELIDGGTATYDDAEVRALAMRGLDAAKMAGAKYADVRINQYRAFILQLSADLLPDNSPYDRVTPSISTHAAVGMRAMIDGTWGFAGGSTLTADAVERVARRAVALARDGRRRIAKPWEYAPAPVVPDGRWVAPIEIDPFTIPIAQYVEIYREGLREARKVKGADPSGQPAWSRSERLFASTEGSVISQGTYESSPGVSASAQRSADRRLSTSVEVEAPAGAYGYETLAALDLKAEWPKAADAAVRRASLPYKSAEVGRYPVVFGSSAMAQMLGPTGRALELDRAVGDKVSYGETTFAMPPLDIVGKYNLGSSLVTIAGDRSRPHAWGTVGWDEEGVKPEEFTLVQDGTVVDYVTTRAYAPTLAPWYERHGRVVRSHGCATRTGRFQPILQLPNLTLKPGPGSTSLDDLIKDVKRGYYVDDGRPIADQQQSNVQFGAGGAYEITNGRLGLEVIDMAIQFALPRFWQNVAALGGAGSAKLTGISVDYSDPDCISVVGGYAVPAVVRELNVITTSREA